MFHDSSARFPLDYQAVALIGQMFLNIANTQNAKFDTKPRFGRLLLGTPVPERQVLVQGKSLYPRAGSLRKWGTLAPKTILTIGHRQGFCKDGDGRKKTKKRNGKEGLRVLCCGDCEPTVCSDNWPKVSKSPGAGAGMSEGLVKTLTSCTLRSLCSF